MFYNILWYMYVWFVLVVHVGWYSKCLLVHVRCYVLLVHVGWSVYVD